MIRLFLGLFILAGIVGSDDYAYATGTEPNSILLTITFAVIGLTLMYFGANKVAKNV